MTIQTKYNVGDVVKVNFANGEGNFYGEILNIVILKDRFHYNLAKHIRCVEEHEIICRMVEEK